MLSWLLLIGLLFVAAAADTSVDPGADPVEAVESRQMYHSLEDDDAYEHHEGKHHRLEWKVGDDYDHKHLGPNMLRVFNPHQIAFNPHNKDHLRIIEHTYSPDYYQPTWILDYRYQKSGGREYTRSDGGQVIILPKGIGSDEKTKFHNYDELLEFLRLKQLAEADKHHHHKPSHKSHGHNHKHDSYDYGFGPESGSL